MNYFKFNKYTIIVAAMFLVALLCVMFNVLLSYLIYPALLLFSVAIFMVALKSTKNYKNKKEEFASKQEEIIMELATSPDGEKYVAESSSYIKKLKRKFRNQKWDYLVVIIFTYALSLLFLGLFIKCIVQLF